MSPNIRDEYLKKHYIKIKHRIDDRYSHCLGASQLLDLNQNGHTFQIKYKKVHSDMQEITTVGLERLPNNKTTAPNELKLCDHQTRRAFF